jgi:hypothetical protein
MSTETEASVVPSPKYTASSMSDGYPNSIHESQANGPQPIHANNSYFSLDNSLSTTTISSDILRCLPLRSLATSSAELFNNPLIDSVFYKKPLSVVPFANWMGHGIPRRVTLTADTAGSLELFQRCRSVFYTLCYLSKNPCSLLLLPNCQILNVFTKHDISVLCCFGSMTSPSHPARLNARPHHFSTKLHNNKTASSSQVVPRVQCSPVTA